MNYYMITTILCVLIIGWLITLINYNRDLALSDCKIYCYNLMERYNVTSLFSDPNIEYFFMVRQ